MLFLKNRSLNTVFEFEGELRKTCSMFQKSSRFFMNILYIYVACLFQSNIEVTTRQPVLWPHTYLKFQINVITTTLLLLNKIHEVHRQHPQ